MGSTAQKARRAQWNPTAIFKMLFEAIGGRRLLSAASFVFLDGGGSLESLKGEMTRHLLQLAR